MGGGRISSWCTEGVNPIRSTPPPPPPITEVGAGLQQCIIHRFGTPRLTAYSAGGAQGDRRPRPPVQQTDLGALGKRLPLLPTACLRVACRGTRRLHRRSTAVWGNGRSRCHLGGSGVGTPRSREAAPALRLPAVDCRRRYAATACWICCRVLVVGLRLCRWSTLAQWRRRGGGGEGSCGCRRRLRSRG